MKRFLSLLFRCVIPFLLFFTVENIAVLAADIFFQEYWDSVNFPLVLTGLVDALMIPVFLGLYRSDGAWHRRPADRSAETGLSRYVLSVIGFLGIYLAVNMFLDIAEISGNDASFQEVNDSIVSASMGLQVLIAGIIGPVMEELLFRGLLLRRTEQPAGPLWAMLISAAMFGVFHGNLTQGLAAFVLGVFLGIAYLCTDSLLVPVLMHAAANCSAVLMGIPGAERVLDSDLFYLGLPCFCALALGLFLRIYATPFRQLLRTRRESRKSESQPDLSGWPGEELPMEEAPEGDLRAAETLREEAVPAAETKEDLRAAETSEGDLPAAELPEENMNEASGEVSDQDDREGDMT